MRYLEQTTLRTDARFREAVMGSREPTVPQCRVRKELCLVPRGVAPLFQLSVGTVKTRNEDGELLMSKGRGVCI